MTQKTRIILFLSFAILCFCTFTVFSFLAEIHKMRRLPVIGQVGDFSLTDANGQTFTSTDLEHKVWVADFFFTTCSDICPMLSKHMAFLSESFKNKSGAIALVSFTVNPEVDSPEVLRNYAKKYPSSSKEKAEENWHFLTGSREAITEIARKGFKLGSIEEPIFHSSSFTLVDRYGFIRGYYDGTTTEGVDKLMKDARKLIKEK